jgi:RimJ/RimL family protein N-acetyltransferase
LPAHGRNPIRFNRAMLFDVIPFPDRLEGARLVVRRYTVEDAAQYFEVALRNRGHLYPHEAENPMRGVDSCEDARALLRTFDDQWAEGSAYYSGVFAREDGRFIAQLYVGSVRPELPSFNLGYICDRAEVGRGYVTEACTLALATLFGHMRAHRVAIWCDESNTRSRAVAERLGFTLDGVLREDRRLATGEVGSTRCYSLLAHEFEALHPRG